MVSVFGSNTILRLLPSSCRLTCMTFVAKSRPLAGSRCHRAARTIRRHPIRLQLVRHIFELSAVPRIGMVIESSCCARGTDYGERDVDFARKSCRSGDSSTQEAQIVLTQTPDHRHRRPQALKPAEPVSVSIPTARSLRGDITVSCCLIPFLEPLHEYQRNSIRARAILLGASHLVSRFRAAMAAGTRRLSYGGTSSPS